MKRILYFVLAFIVSNVIYAQDSNFYFMKQNQKFISTQLKFDNNCRSINKSDFSLNFNNNNSIYKRNIGFSKYTQFSVDKLGINTTFLDFAFLQNREIHVLPNISNLLYNTGSKSRKSGAGKKVGRFFLGALVGAASAGIAILIMESEEDGGVPGDYKTWIIGGAVLGGILFVIDF